MLHGRYEKNIRVLQGDREAGSGVIDIGAHIGYFTRLFAKLVEPQGTVYALEADPENCKLLKKNTRHLPNVHVCQAAATDRTGSIDFYHYDDKAGCHSILANVLLDLRKTENSSARCLARQLLE